MDVLLSNEYPRVYKLILQVIKWNVDIRNSINMFILVIYNIKIHYLLLEGYEGTSAWYLK